MRDDIRIGEDRIALPERVQKFFLSARVPLSLSDASMADQPLLAINPLFTELTGYAEDAALGRNCRFLQPQKGAGPVRDRIRAFIDRDGRGGDSFVLANETRDGRAFVNLLFLTRIGWKAPARLILGAQFDLTRFTGAGADLFERARREDLSPQRLLDGDTGAAIVGSLHTLSSSAGVILQTYFDESERL